VSKKCQFCYEPVKVNVQHIWGTHPPHSVRKWSARRRKYSAPLAWAMSSCDLKDRKASCSIANALHLYFQVVPRTPAILAKGFRGFPQSLHGNARTIPLATIISFQVNWNEVAVAYLNVLFVHLIGETKTDLS
jgi:hypothetical protein